MLSTSHKPYFRFEDGTISPVLGFEKQTGTKYQPLVPNGEGELVLASSLGSGVIISLPEVSDEKEILHG